MYSFIHSFPLRNLLVEHIPALAISFLISEMFYKFHSFTLECLAFLATWYILDSFHHLMLRKFRKAGEEDLPGEKNS